MTTKQLAVRAIEDVPEDASWYDVQDRINLMAGIRKALGELDAGAGVPHEQIKQESESWPSG